MKKTLRNYLKQAPVTATVIAFCALAWAVTAIQSHSLTASYYGSSLAYDWTLWGPDFEAAPLTALSAGFMHIDLGHLAVNMFLLLLVGREIEQALGGVLYACVYLLSLLGASAAVLGMDYQTPTVGASGAIYALLALLVGLYDSRGMDLRAPIVLVVANVAYTFLMSGVSLWGHLGGLFTGVILAFFVFNSRRGVRWTGVFTVFLALSFFLGLQAGFWG